MSVSRAAVALAVAVLCVSACTGGGDGDDDAGRQLPRLPAEASYVAWTEEAPALDGDRPVRLEPDPRLVGLERTVTVTRVRTARGISPVETAAPTGPPETSAGTAGSSQELEAGATPPARGGVAARGQELLAAEVEHAVEDELNLETLIKGESTLALRVDGQDRDLPDSQIASGNRGGPLTIIASVPKGAPVHLVLTDDGRSQSLDLRTGRRGSDAVDEFYRPVLAGPRKAVHWQATVTLTDARPGAPARETVQLGWPDREAAAPDERAYRGLNSGFRLIPYKYGHGWAPEGKLWLELTVPGGADEDWFTYRIDARRTYAVEADGATYRARTHPDSMTPAVLVPADFRSGTLRITPHGEATGKSVRGWDVEATGSTASPATPATIPIRLERVSP